MAQSPSHKFGQIIGDLLEEAIKPRLQECASKYGLYLDTKGPRPARSGKKLSWQDSYGNIHDLDFVLERGGTAHKIGSPVAFIEIAWRRYTKHSRNKAQEIQAAVLPLRDTHYRSAPFLGAILAGVFTEGAITQLSSQGFNVLYFPYDSIVEAFKTVGLNALFDEQTPDEEFHRKVEQWERLGDADKIRVSRVILELNEANLEDFMEKLETSITRQISRIIVLPLYGEPHSLQSVDEAITFINRYSPNAAHDFVRFEIIIEYNNGDRIEGKFSTKDVAIEFLDTYRAAKFHCND